MNSDNQIISNIYNLIYDKNVILIKKALNDNFKLIENKKKWESILDMITERCKSEKDIDNTIELLIIVLKYGADPYKANSIYLSCDPPKPFKLFKFWIDYKIDVYKDIYYKKIYRGCFVTCCTEVGDLEKIKYLFDVMKIDPNYINEYTKYNLFSYAIISLNRHDEHFALKKIRFLINKGENNYHSHDDKGDNAYDIAIKKNFTGKILKLLKGEENTLNNNNNIEYDYYEPEPLLFTAINNLDPNNIQKELNKSTNDINAIYHTNTPLGIIQFMEINDDNYKVVIDILNLLLKYGADPYKSDTLAIVCSPIRSLSLFKFWISGHIDIYRPIQSRSLKGSFVNFCIQFGDMKRIKIMFDKCNVDPNFIHPDTGMNLFSYVFSSDEPDFSDYDDPSLIEKKIKFLLKKGASNLDHRDLFMRSAYDIAIKKDIKHLKILILLLREDSKYKYKNIVYKIHNDKRNGKYILYKNNKLYI